MILTDTHAHLYAEQFSEDREEMLKRAFDSGVKRIFLPAIDTETHQQLIALADQFPSTCFPMMGLHPCSVDAATIEKEFAAIEEWHARRKFIAVGEIGIDLYWDKTQLALQQEIFAKQIDLALKLKLPVIIHSRSAFKECYDIVKEKKLGKGGEHLKGIFHCFSDGIEEAQKVIALGGFMMGIGGVLTFKNSGLDKVVEHFGSEHFVLETDAPYLAPVPNRGKRNESSYLVHIAKKFAEIKKCTVEELAQITTENSRTIFGI
ncbi:MAG TPA: TatD family hydrolase [Bacteroidia bacterium]|nr:TatD family hydrolase [Bacteroidia bacterium]